MLSRNAIFPTMIISGLALAAVAMSVVPADAQGNPALRKKCGQWAANQVPTINTPGDAKRRAALFQLCLEKGGNV
jgi:hypothetical protein